MPDSHPAIAGDLGISGEMAGGAVEHDLAVATSSSSAQSPRGRAPNGGRSRSAQPRAAVVGARRGAQGAPKPARWPGARASGRCAAIESERTGQEGGRLGEARLPQRRAATRSAGLSSAPVTSKTRCTVASPAAQRQLVAALARAGVGLQQHAQAGGVDEGEAAEVDHDAAGAGVLERRRGAAPAAEALARSSSPSSASETVPLSTTHEMERRPGGGRCSLIAGTLVSELVTNSTA